MDEGMHACHEVQGRGRKKGWYRNPLFLTSSASLLLFAISYLVPVLLEFRRSFLAYLKMVWFPIGLGFVLGGLIDYYVPREYISKYLSGKGRRTVFYATTLGFFMAACSHGIIALSMELHKKGASGPAVVSFLLASPWANLPITLLLIGFFGWKGLLIIGSALLISITTGLVFQVLDRKGWIEKNKHSVSLASDFSVRLDFQERIRAWHFSAPQLFRDLKGVCNGIYSLITMVLWWVLAGIVLASLISAFIPETIFHRFLGPSFLGLLITIVLAAILEICSEGTSPLAFEIYRQTGALGNAFAFLMGGVVTDYTEIGLVWINLGKKTALWMIAVTLPQVFLLSWMFNLFF